MKFYQEFKDGQRLMGARCAKCGKRVVAWRWCKTKDGWLNRSKIIEMAKPYIETHREYCVKGSSSDARQLTERLGWVRRQIRLREGKLRRIRERKRGRAPKSVNRTLRVLKNLKEWEADLVIKLESLQQKKLEG